MTTLEEAELFGFEIGVLKFFESIRTDFLNFVFEAVTMLSEETLMIVLIAIVWFAFDKRLAEKIFFISLVSLGINSTTKNLAKIPRPWTTGEVTCVRPDTATGYSFPSGHTQNFATWSTLAARNLKRTWLTAAVAVLIPLVAVSRIYLGAHYPSDVIVALILGVGVAVIGDVIYERVSDKRKLYIGMTVFFTPFAVVFMISGDPLFADFFKFYGATAALVLAISFEEKFAPISYDVPWWKKVIRVVFGIALAYGIKEGIKALNVFDLTQISFMMDAIRYFVLVFVCFGFYPWIIKKLKI